MENITTELKLKVAQLEKEKKEAEEKCVSVLRENDRLIASLMVDVATYKSKLKKAQNKIKDLHTHFRITNYEYIEIMEELSD